MGSYLLHPCSRLRHINRKGAPVFGAPFLFIRMQVFEPSIDRQDGSTAERSEVTATNGSHQIAGSDLERPKAGPQGGGQG